jgi:PAS domain S-box-containing protein
VWDVVTGEVHWSDEMYRIYGFDPGSITPSADVFFNLVHPDDRGHTADAFNRVVREKSEYDLIFRVVRSDGTIRDIHSVGHAVVDGTGLVTEVVGTAMDVTEHKQAEDALRASEERFRRYFDLGLVGMAMTSLSKGCLEVNDELCRILGYSRDELLKKTWVDLTHPDDVAADLAEFNKVLAGDKDVYTLDKRWIRKDGRIVYSIMAAQCVRRADGSVDYFIGLVQDITARKQAEETAREAHERLDTIVNSISDQFFALSKDWRFTYFNDHAARQMWMLGRIS